MLVIWHKRQTIVISLIPSDTFTPASLFQNGSPGAWYKFSDLATLFTTDAGTTRVTADGQTIGLVLDLSGNDNHLPQSTAGKRPVLASVGVEKAANFDGVDDTLELLSTNLQINGELTLFARVSVPDVTYRGTILSCQTAITTKNSYAWELLTASDDPLKQPHYVIWASDSGFGSAFSYGNVPADTATALGVWRTTGTTTLDVDFWAGGAQANPEYSAENLFAAPTSVAGTSVFRLGGRSGGTRYFKGKIIEVLIIGRALTASELINVKAYFDPQ